MVSSHPFMWLTERGQRGVFVVFSILTVVVMVSLQVLGGPLKTEAALAGIISYEFAGELGAARAMVASWGAEGQVYAGLSLGLDYLFMAAYSVAIGLGCVLVARGLAKRVSWLAPVGVVLAWAQFVAAVLDALENYSLIRVLLGSGNALWPRVAQWCAGPKFALVGLGLLYVLVGAVIVAVVRKKS